LTRYHRRRKNLFIVTFFTSVENASFENPRCKRGLALNVFNANSKNPRCKRLESTEYET
ncbi:MAG: hypothetical protein RL060_1528, partial [Bacteroidota bacterium]